MDFSEIGFMVQVSRGKIPGLASLNKHGKAGNIAINDGFVDIWDGQTLAAAPNTYTFSSIADIGSLSSSDTADKSIIEIQGLDLNWDEVTQNATLDGTTVVALDTSLIRVNRMENMGDALVGNTFCYVDGSTVTAGVPTPKSNIRSIIQNGLNQTQQTIFSVAANKNILVTNFWANIAIKTAVASVVHFQVRRFGQEFSVKQPGGVNSTGTGHFQHFWIPYLKYPEKSDIKVEGDSSANGGALAAGFDTIIVDGR